jgi:hypothetical protein
VEKDSFRFQMKVAGRERKEVAGLIAGHFGVQAEYLGAPCFGYLITDTACREWRIDKSGIVTTQWRSEDNAAEMFAILKTLADNGVEASGQVAVTLSAEGHNGVSLRNLVNILAAKERLIAKAMGVAGQSFIAQPVVAAINAARLRTVDDFLEAAGDEDCPGIKITKDNITFRWFAATLDPDAIQAYIQFAFAVNKMALTQKHSSPHETDTKNEKYTFRVWLLRLGFIGEGYKSSRALFLNRLCGNGSFRTAEQVQAAAKRRKERSVK